MSEIAGEEPGKSPAEELTTIVIENNAVEVTKRNDGNVENGGINREGDELHIEIKILEEGEKCNNGTDSKRNDESIPQVLVNKPLCADYESSTDTESDSDSSSDSDSDSSTADSDSDTSSEASFNHLREMCDEFEGRKRSDKKDGNIDLELSDLPPIENLRISVPEEECQEIGTITSIVDTLVVVQAYKDTPALDLDSVLFLDNGKKSLGRIFDVLGPISEPVYTIRFNNVGEIDENNIAKGVKVYCAPKTEYTSFVFVTELMKMKGSDASWKNNEEAPSECQEFSDDEEENNHKHGGKSSVSSRRTDISDNLNRKRGKVHPGRPANYRNPFALGHSRGHRFSQPSPNGSFPYPNPPQPPYPTDNSRTQFYNLHRSGMMMRPGFPMMHPYPYQQYPTHPMQQFSMPPVMPPPPPPPPPVYQFRNNYPATQTPTRVFGSNIENPSQNG